MNCLKPPQHLPNLDTADWYKILAQRLSKAKGQPIKIHIPDTNLEILICTYYGKSWNPHQNLYMTILPEVSIPALNLRDAIQQLTHWEDIVQNIQTKVNRLHQYQEHYANNPAQKQEITFGMTILQEAYMRGVFDKLEEADWTNSGVMYFLNDISQNSHNDIEYIKICITRAFDHRNYVNLYQEIYHKMPQEDLSIYSDT